eukprot:TRINITY_DN68698_c0_g1_i1.p1 TRINITY_DN68698_c0_g1~~TRINITY_DN68698_c0_g1_i1.p1  ORF type:complete len:237 (+),score=66.51 TRINITY_DN68698_c0_g1_i1:156-866(+)
MAGQAGMTSLRRSPGASYLAALFVAIFTDGAIHAAAAESMLRGGVAFVPEASMDKVKKLLKNRLAASLDAYSEEATTATYCKGQLKDAKTRLAKQSKVVKEKMHALKEAKLVDDEHLKGLLRDAGHQRIDAARQLDRAQRNLAMKAPALYAVNSSFANSTASPSEAQRWTEQEFRDAKFELKQEMRGLGTVSREFELLREQCLRNAEQSQSYEWRMTARNDELESLKNAYDLLGGF